jgi:hypothetical protein
MAHFWDIICGGSFLGHLIGGSFLGHLIGGSVLGHPLYVAHFWAFLPDNSWGSLSREVDKNDIRLFYNWEVS